MTSFHVRLFGRLAPIYARLWKPLVLGLVSGGGFAEERRALFALHDPLPGGTALDVGCGPGTFTLEVAGRTAPALVVDLDAARPMLRQGRAAALLARRDNVAWLEGDAETLPVRKGSVSLVVCCGVLHLLPRPERALREIAATLAPGGVVLGMTLVEGELMLERALAVLLARLLRFRFFPRPWLEEALRDAGLALEDSRRARFMLLFRARRTVPEGIRRDGTQPVSKEDNAHGTASTGSDLRPDQARTA